MPTSTLTIPAVSEAKEQIRGRHFVFKLSGKLSAEPKMLIPKIVPNPKMATKSRGYRLLLNTRVVIKSIIPVKRARNVKSPITPAMLAPLYISRRRA